MAAASFSYAVCRILVVAVLIVATLSSYGMPKLYAAIYTQKKDFEKFQKSKLTVLSLHKSLLRSTGWWPQVSPPCDTRGCGSGMARYDCRGKCEDFKDCNNACRTVFQYPPRAGCAVRATVGAALLLHQVASRENQRFIITPTQPCKIDRCGTRRITGCSVSDLMHWKFAAWLAS